MAFQVDQIIKDHIVRLVTRKLLGALASRFAFFAWGPAGFVAGWIIEKVIDKALEQTILGVTLLYIEIDTNNDVRAVRRVVDEIKSVPKEEMTKEKARELDDKLAEAYLDLIDFGTVNQ